MPAYIVLDTQDPEPLIDFYCKLQGIEVFRRMLVQEHRM